MARDDALGAQPGAVTDRRRRQGRAQDLVDAECENTGKPKALTKSEEIPPMVDQIRFFAGALPTTRGSFGR